MKRPVKPLQLPQPGFWLCVPVCYLPCRAGAAQHGASGLVGGTRPVRWAVRGPTARVRGGPGRGGCPVARGRLGLSPGFLPPGRRGLRGQGRPAGPSGASAMRSTLEAGGAAPVSCGRRGQGHHERPGAAAGPGRGGVPGRGRGSRHCQAHIRGLDPQVGCAQDGAPHLRRESARSKHSSLKERCRVNAELSWSFLVGGGCAGVRDWRLLFPGSCHARGERAGGSRTGRSPAAQRRRRRP